MIVLKRNNKHNVIPDIVFLPVRFEKILSILLTFIIFIISIYLITLKDIITANILKEICQFCIIIILTILALSVTVFQSSDKITRNQNTKDNKYKIYIRYIYYVFDDFI